MSLYRKITRRDFLKMTAMAGGGLILASCEPFLQEESSITPIAAQKSIPIILNTDIGIDIDDTWALAMLLNSPELDIKLIVTSTGNTLLRAKIVAKILEIAGRVDIPIGVGIRQEDTGMEYQADWVEDYDLSHFPGIVYQDGVEAMVNTVQQSTGVITLVSIAAMTNVAEALDRTPLITNQARIIGMHGSIRRGYHDDPQPVAEYNVLSDIPACKKVDTASWDVTITPLDTCGIVSLRGEDYNLVKRSRHPLAKAVMENYDIWLHNCPADLWNGIDTKTESTILFDTVAGYLALSESFVTIEDLKIAITNEGFTVIDESGKEVHCATGWKDMNAFKKFVATRVAG